MPHTPRVPRPSHSCPPPGYAKCTRSEGHDGPCAHPLDDQPKWYRWNGAEFVPVITQAELDERANEPATIFQAVIAIIVLGIIAACVWATWAGTVDVIKALFNHIR